MGAGEAAGWLLGRVRRDEGVVVVKRERAGAPISGFDAEIAAICRGHGAELATRNTAGFDLVGLDLVDPWTAGT